MSLWSMLERYAREMMSLSDDWCIYRASCEPLGHERTLYYDVAGAVAPVKPNGCRNWRKKDPASVRKLIIPADTHAEFTKGWEKRTNTCAECDGSGQTMASAGISGTTYRACSKCKGTGKPAP